MSKRAEKKEDLSYPERQPIETPPDFSQFRGRRLDKQPSAFVDGLVHVLLTGIGAVILLAIVYALFKYM